PGGAGVVPRAREGIEVGRAAEGRADVNASADHRELEWQLAAQELDSVRQWLTERAGAAGWRCEPRATVEHHDIYLDTDDWGIHRAGFALRVREAAGKHEATLKELRPARQGFADRRELS